MKSKLKKADWKDENVEVTVRRIKLEENVEMTIRRRKWWAWHWRDEMERRKCREKEIERRKWRDGNV